MPTTTSPAAVTPAALDGLRVIDMTQVMAGPFCCMLLGDMGADVVKVEPLEGEATRHMAMQVGAGISAPFLAVNRNKRGIALDLKRPEGAAVLERLAARADVLVENYRPGVARRLGVDHERLAALNERLVYCSISGFGQDRPVRRPGGLRPHRAGDERHHERDGEPRRLLGDSACSGWCSASGRRSRRPGAPRSKPPRSR